MLALHGSLFGDDRERHAGAEMTALPLPGAGPELRAAVAARRRAAARELPREDPVLFALGGGALESELVRAAPAARELSALGPVAVLLGLAVLLARRRWRAPTRRLGLRRAALGIALAGGMTVAATAIARAVVLSTFDTSHGDAVVATIWSAFLADLRLWGLAIGAGA